MAYDYLIKLYLDYTNNYLTLAKFAEHHCISEVDARKLIDLGKSYNEHGPEL
jgi:hypothetical protein